MPKMSILDLKAMLASEKANALAAISAAQLMEERADAMDYYLGDMRKDMPAQDGRSRAVSTDVADTIEGLMPTLMDIFAGSDEVVRFEPVGPEDEAAAQQETDYVNHVFMQQNPGFMILYSFIKDALLSKVGIVKVWWEEREEESRETYYDLTDDQFALIAQAVMESGGAMKIVAHTVHDAADAADDGEKIGGDELMNMATPLLTLPSPAPPASPLTHDVTIVTTRKLAQARVLGVPPEEFGIERGARNIQDCNYCFHEVVTKTEAQLIAEGFDEEQVKSLGEYTGNTEIETLARDTVAEHFSTPSGGVNSAARLVRITEHYVRMDYEGNGRPCLYQVVTGGDQGEILCKGGKECITPFDAIPFATTTPVPVTHRFFGRSIADLVMPLQREKTALKRGALDNLYLHNNPRVEVSEANAGPEYARRSLGIAPGRRGSHQDAGRPELAGGARHHRLDLPDAAISRRRARNPQRARQADPGHRRQRAAKPVGDRGRAGVFGLSNAYKTDRAHHGGGRARYFFTVARHDPQAWPATADGAAAQRLDQCRSAGLEDPRRYDHQCRARLRRQAPGLGQGARIGNDRSVGRICFGDVESRGVVLFRQARVRECRQDHQAMNEMHAEDIRKVVAETLAEQHRLQHDEIDAVVLRAIATILTSFGIEEEDRKELRADFQHLRRWRKSVEQAQSYTFKAVITIIVTGLVGAVWLGVKVMLGK